MEKDLQYLKFCEKTEKAMRACIERLKPLEERSPLEDFILILTESALQEGEEDLTTLPEIHIEAAAADSWETFYYYLRYKQGYLYKEIAGEAAAYRKFASANTLSTSNYVPTGRSRGADQPRKRLDKAIREYEPNTDKSKGSERMTDKRLKQLPFLRALLDMMKDGADLPELEAKREEIERELAALLDFISDIERTASSYDTLIIKLRYLNGLSWDSIAKQTTGTGETVRKIAERLIERQNNSV